MGEQYETRYATALDMAAQLLGTRLEPFLELGPGEPSNGADFTRLATLHAFGDAWPRHDHLDLRTRALVSVTIAATLGTLEPLRGQLRIALNNGVTAEGDRRGLHPARGVRRSCACVRQLPNRTGSVRRARRSRVVSYATRLTGTSNNQSHPIIRCSVAGADPPCWTTDAELGCTSPNASSGSAPYVVSRRRAEAERR